MTLLLCVNLDVHAQKKKNTDNIILINAVAVPKPAWWSGVEVTIPDSVYSVPDLDLFIQSLTANDTGITRDHRTIKAWALGLQKLDVFPIALAQQYSMLLMHKESAKLYALLHKKAHTQKGKELEYECSMAYYAAKEYEAQPDKENALQWYRKAINLKYEKAGGEPARYYSLAQCAYRCLMNIACEN